MGSSASGSGRRHGSALFATKASERTTTGVISRVASRQASITVLISGVVERTKLKYGERGYRYALLDIGHLGQNIYLSSTCLDLAIMTTCGFYDDEANKLLRLDGVNETAMYVAFIGKGSGR